MDQLIQPVLKISELALAGIKNGDLHIDGGVVRVTASGRIFEILKPVNLKDSVTDINVRKSTALSLGKKFTVGFIVVVGVTAISYGTYRLYTYLKRRSSQKKNEESNNEVIIYNPELTEYFNNMQMQSMSISSIKQVIEFFEKFSNGDLSIEISKEEMLVIRNIIVRYTIKLCESNNISLSDKQLNIETNKVNEHELLLEAISALMVQEEIFLMVNNKHEKKGKIKNVKVQSSN